MITLTNPFKVGSSLGGTTTVNYDILVVYNIMADPVSNTISAGIKLVVSADATQPAINGTLVITASTGVVNLQIPSLGFIHVYTVTSAESTIAGWITSLQNSIESGLVSIGAVSGVQASGV